MNKNNGSPSSFFDPKTIIAIVITLLIFVGWQNYMHRKYPHVFNKEEKQTESVFAESNQENAEEESSQPATNGNNKETLKTATNQNDALPEEEKINIDNEIWDLEFSSYGLEITRAEIKKYKERDFSYKKFEKLFKTSLLNSKEPLIFDIEQDGEKVFGVYTSPQGTIKKTITVDSANYSMIVDYEFDGDFPGISTFIEMPIKENQASSFFMPNFDKQEYFVANKGETHRDIINNKDFSSRIFDQVKILALGTHFFAQAIVDNSTLKPNALVFTDGQSTAVARLDYTLSSQVRSFRINQKYFIGPKDDVILQNVDESFVDLINFGFLKVVCYPILKILKFFYSLFSNYGIAIILLTLLMRILVFPLAYRGYKSMAKMQKIQPQLKAIREKHKNDPQKANLQTMALMKEAKVNPLGGCMPMLLQLPIFFALYRVLSESVVMYQAPFFLWIQDLSLKDPYYVLPVLMGATMFIQQKLTPTAMDPMQKKIMLFMPVIFSFFMISLPSALTLYIFVSTLFGVLQQYLFTRAKS